MAPVVYNVGVQGPIADLSTGTFTPASLPAGATWVFNDNPMYAIFSLMVGAPWAGPPDGTSTFPAQMVVDWIRYDPA